MKFSFDNLADAPVPILFLVVIVLAIITAGLVMLFSRWRKPTLLIFNNENGRVEISRATIQKVVQRTCERFMEVGWARTYLRQSKGYIHIKVRLKLGVKTRIQDISNHLQKQITRAIRDDLGIKSLADVTVVVEGLMTPVEPEEN